MVRICRKTNLIKPLIFRTFHFHCLLEFAHSSPNTSQHLPIPQLWETFFFITSSRPSSLSIFPFNLSNNFIQSLWIYAVNRGIFSRQSNLSTSIIAPNTTDNLYCTFNHDYNTLFLNINFITWFWTTYFTINKRTCISSLTTNTV